MKNILLLSIVLLTIGCKKDKSASPTTSSVDIAKEIGLEFEHNYKLGIKPDPVVSNRRVIFHANSTITEIAYQDTVTYSAVLVYTTDFSPSILQNGKAARLYIQQDTSIKAGLYDFYAAAADFYQMYGSRDTTAVLGTFLSGDIVQNNKPTLGCTFRLNSYAIMQY